MILPLDDITSALIGFTPLLFLAGMPWWKEQDLLDKCVTGFLAVWCMGSALSRHMAIQSFCVFALFAFIYAIKNKHYRIPHGYYWFFAYFIWHAISLIWTPDISMGLGQLRVYTLFVFIPLIFGCIQLNKTQRDGILLSFARTMMCFQLITLAYWFYQTNTMGIPAMNWIILDKFRIGNQAVYDIVLGWCNYHHPTYSGYSMLTALIVYYYHCSHNNTSKGKTYAETFIYSLCSLAVLVLIQSRTGVISWAIVNALGLAYLLRKNKKKLVGYSITLAVLSCFVLLYKHQAVMDYIEDPIREQNIKTAAYFIQKHPLLGSGIEGIRTEMASHEVAHLLGYAYANTAFGNPHHQWIGDWMQTGIVGLALITIIVGQLFYKSIKNRNWMLGMFGIISLILMQIEMPFYLHKGVVSFLLFTCLMELPNHTSIQQLNKKGLS